MSQLYSVGYVLKDGNDVKPHAKIQNTSHQASILCDILRGLTSYLFSNAQWSTALCSLSVLKYTSHETGTETVLYHYLEHSIDYFPLCKPCIVRGQYTS